MELGLRGKAALLIGASRGIGGAAALALAREGCKVAVVARDRAAAEQRAQACRDAGAERALGLSADATDVEALRTAVDAAARDLGGLQILVTLVGGSSPQGFAELDEAGWQTAFSKNFWAAVNGSRLALPHLLAQARSPPDSEREGGGSGRDVCVILHVASIWGREGGGAVSYNAAKAALISLAHEQNRELAPRGIRALSVAPGSTLHPGGSWERRRAQDPEGIAALVARELPFGRFGTAEELGDVIAFLCSPRASWVAGACVVVDGGQSRAF